MKTNTKSKAPAVHTHGGAPAAYNPDAYAQLRRSVLSCLLFEDTYYEDGKSIADRISDLAAHIEVRKLADLAIEARTVHNLRHVPLLLLCALVKRGGSVVGLTIEQVIQRADELSEFLALYWKQNGGKKTLSKQVKLGLARAFRKFDAYQLAKYNRDADVKLRDVLFLVHAKPKDEPQAVTWKHLVEGTLKTPDTWEVELSAGKGEGKRESWERLLNEGKLGYFALLRNLRNMLEAGIDPAVLARHIALRKRGAEKVLPFRYVAAMRAAPSMAPALDASLAMGLADTPKFKGSTLVLVDVSGSMDAKISQKSDLSRADAAAAVAALFHGEHVRVFTFSNSLVEVPAWRGLAGIDGILKSQPHGGTELAEAVTLANQFKADRIVVITDEQATDGHVPAPAAPLAYLVNVAPYQHGVNFGGRWTQVNGFSEGILRWMAAIESDVYV